MHFARALAPAVVVSRDVGVIRYLVDALFASGGAHRLPAVNPEEYKMMRSLYDPRDVPNLREDILALGGGNGGPFVAAELLCATPDGQMCIREMIEDSPSATAFSTGRSALHKDGLFFGVHVKGEVTPEILSRASLFI